MKVRKTGFISNGARLLLACMALLLMTAMLPMRAQAAETEEVYTSRDELIQAIRQLLKDRGEGMEYVAYEQIYWKNLYVSKEVLDELDAETEYKENWLIGDDQLISDVFAEGTDQTECENNEGDYLVHENAGGRVLYPRIEGSLTTATCEHLDGTVTEETILIHSSQDYDYMSFYTIEVDGITYYPCLFECSGVYSGGSGEYTEFSTTKAQEEQLDTDLYNLCHTGELSQYLSSDAYTKIKAVQDYVEGHVTYSTLGNSDVYYLTAVSAYYEGLADCRGYALLMYRLMREMDIPVRIVDTGTHVWNIVYIDGAWYSCDASAENGTLLKGTDTVTAMEDVKHPGIEEYETNIWAKVSATDYVASTDSSDTKSDSTANQTQTTDLNGLAVGSDGNWYYYTNGTVDTGYTGMACNEYGWWYVTNGALDWGYTGMACNEYGWWYFTNGALDWNYTGMACNDYGWWYITGGALDWNYTGMACNEYGWWYMTGGALDWNYTGMACNEYGWWYMTGGALDWNYTGLALNEYGWWYMSNGALDWNYTGMAENEYGWWYVTNGALDWNYTGEATNDIGTWWFENGILQGAVG